VGPRPAAAPEGQQGEEQGRQRRADGPTAAWHTRPLRADGTRSGGAPDGASYQGGARLPREEWNADDADQTDWRGSEREIGKKGGRHVILLICFRSAEIRRIRVIRVPFPFTPPPCGFAGTPCPSPS